MPKSDIEIAREAKMKPVKDILDHLNVPDSPEAYSPMGRHIAKINLEYLEKHKDKKDGKLILKFIEQNQEFYDEYYSSSYKIKKTNSLKTKDSISLNLNVKYKTGNGAFGVQIKKGNFLIGYVADKDGNVLDLKGNINSQWYPGINLKSTPPYPFAAVTVSKTLRVVNLLIDLKTKFFENNYGVKNAPVKGINWLFENV